MSLLNCPNEKKQLKIRIERRKNFFIEAFVSKLLPFFKKTANLDIIINISL